MHFYFFVIFHIPGCAATVACLTIGLVSFMQKNRERSQLMMRGRVAAQAFTIGAMAFSLFFAAPKNLGRSKTVLKDKAREGQASAEVK